uniref:Uncharacterized protein LOC114335962 n=1 Tax=Diabrotica virgifera virgifera TaxID=50390 RepID=A0A6P7FZN0_DIAVI
MPFQMHGQILPTYNILDNKWNLNISLQEDLLEDFQEHFLQELPTFVPLVRTRWKKCDPTKWKRNIKRRETLESKATKPIDCSKCRFKCTDKFSQHVRDIICKNYWSKNFKDRKTFILSKVESHPPERRRPRTGSKKLRVDTKKYFLEYNSCNLRVCREFFTRTLLISNTVIEHAFQFKGEGGVFTSNDQRGKTRKNKDFS